MYTTCQYGRTQFKTREDAKNPETVEQCDEPAKGVILKNGSISPKLCEEHLDEFSDDETQIFDNAQEAAEHRAVSFTKEVQIANQHGTKKVTIPHYITGPTGEEIEVGDEVTLKVVRVAKQGDTDS